MSGWLVVESPNLPGSWAAAIPLANKDITIGRGKGCDVVLDAPRLSRKALRIVPQADCIEVFALEEDRPFTLAGSQCQQAIIKVGQTFAIAGRQLRYEQSPPKGRRKKSTEAVAKDSGPSSITGAFRAFLETVGRPSNPETLLQRLLLGVVELFSAERGFVLVRSGEKGPLLPLASHAIENLDELVAVSSTVYERVMKTGNVVFVENSLADERTKEAVSLRNANVPRTLMAAPLSTGKEIFGVVYVDRPWQAAQEISFDDGLLSTIGAIAASVLAAEKTRRNLLFARERFGALSATMDYGRQMVLGPSPKSAELNKLLEAAAPMDVSVLISGQTGTGKEVIARTIHKKSARHRGPFVPVHCAALAGSILEAELFGVKKGAFSGADEDRMGRFEVASGGTVFLDEVAEIPLEVQVKLLRILQERTVTRLGDNEKRELDFRLLCATNVSLEEAVQEGRFRADLYYRLNVFRVAVPSLLERKDDIETLALHFLKTLAPTMGKEISEISTGALKKLQAYRWPGNIRELRNAIERAIVIEQSHQLTADSLTMMESPSASPKDLFATYPDRYDEAREVFERDFFRHRLQAHEGRMEDLAQATGISRRTLYRRLVNLGLLGEK